jgi:hypothetical protein
MTTHRPFRLRALLAALALAALASPWAHAADTAPLTIKGRQFLDASGAQTRFWGVNMAAVYPDHATADGIAATLASLQINLVRPHHLLRQSQDWTRKPNLVALANYKDNSRDQNPDAWDRFDYLNAQLKKNGIYLAMSTHQSRTYLPGDVDILKTDAADAAAWQAAMKELNGWDWKKAIDIRKSLPTVDERAALLNEEFAKYFLTHVNPYTKTAYAADPQVLTLEIVNESSLEYAIICGNKFPAYWDKKLQDRWQAFAASEKILEPGDLYSPKGDAALAARAKFLRKLDEDYFLRMKKAIRDTGCKAAITYSNLWRGENALGMQSAHADFIEDHAYSDPLVVRTADDWALALSRTDLKDKPFFVGEFNISEGSEPQRRQAPVRSQLPLAASAYGSLHDWSGVVYFAWAHGDSKFSPSGWSDAESRQVNLGDLVTDAMTIDHLRTTGMIFRNKLLDASKSPIIVPFDENFVGANYGKLMGGQPLPKAGWQNIHAVYKSPSAAPAPKDAPWLKAPPEGPLTSDTGQIIKDVARKQLTVAAPQVEAFSGYLDAKAPANLKHISLGAQDGFATVIAVSDDTKPLNQSDRIIISRTAIDPAERERADLPITLQGLKQPAAGQSWQIKLTRPRPLAAALKDYANLEFKPVQTTPQGALILPASIWTECELHLK